MKGGDGRDPLFVLEPTRRREEDDIIKCLLIVPAYLRLIGKKMVLLPRISDVIILLELEKTEGVDALYPTCIVARKITLFLGIHKNVHLTTGVLLRSALLL